MMVVSWWSLVHTGLSDASALLWRMNILLGQPVGSRWEQLLPYWLPHQHEHVTSFNDMHMMMSFLQSPNITIAESALQSMRDLATGPTVPATNQEVLRLVGLNVVEGLTAFKAGDYRRTIDLLYPKREHWIRIGGSHAQRDVIMLTLLEACVRNSTDLPLAARLLSERYIVKDPQNQAGTLTLLDQVKAQLDANKRIDDEVCTEAATVS